MSRYVIPGTWYVRGADIQHKSATSSQLTFQDDEPQHGNMKILLYPMTVSFFFSTKTICEILYDFV